MEATVMKVDLVNRCAVVAMSRSTFLELKTKHSGVQWEQEISGQNFLARHQWDAMTGDIHWMPQTMAPTGRNSNGANGAQ